MEPVRSAEVVTLIKTTAVYGKGLDGDVIREVVQYWSPEGDLVATVDPAHTFELMDPFHEGSGLGGNVPARADVAVCEIRVNGQRHRCITGHPLGHRDFTALAFPELSWGERAKAKIEGYGLTGGEPAFEVTPSSDKIPAEEGLVIHAMMSTPGIPFDSDPDMNKPAMGVGGPEGALE